MKKTFLLRLFALGFFCIAFLSIKSETTSCKMQCRFAAQNATLMKSFTTGDVHVSPLSHDDGFFIKI